MDISPTTAAELVKARGAISLLQDTAKKAAAQEEHERAELERDVAAASKAFLSQTEPEKLDLQVRAAKRVGKDPSLDQGWVTLRFRITVEQRDVIWGAMERAREIAQVPGKLWKGVALEYVAADFVAGHGMPGDPLPR
jgi:hypothetical protein